MHQRSLWRLSLLLTVSASLFVAACKQTDDAVTPQTPGSITAATGAPTDQVVNQWILDNMKYWYYWNDKIPVAPNLNQTPDKFFDSILYKFDATARPDGDRFSWIEKSAAQLTASLNGEETTTGMEFRLARRAAGANDLLGTVLYVYPGSPAAQAGFQRGDIFYAVNGQALTLDNYQSLLYNDQVTNFTFGLATLSGGQFTNTNETKTAKAITFQEDPVLKDSVYSIGGRKIGYFVYTRFIAAPNGSNVATFNQKMDAAFAKFKAAGVNELVLDLRYNLGGQSTASDNLINLVAKGAEPSKLMYYRQYNPQVQADAQRQFGANFGKTFFTTKAQNIGANLNRVYVLVTSRSASASELTINALKPYMPVVLIGETTYGKNVGSITISDDRKLTDESQRIKWGLQPIVTMTFNSANQSDYSAGFAPDIQLSDALPFRQFGDVQERYLSEAIFRITGTRPGVGGRLAAGVALPVVGASVDRHANSGLVFEKFK